MNIDCPRCEGEMVIIDALNTRATYQCHRCYLMVSIEMWQGQPPMDRLPDDGDWAHDDRRDRRLEERDDEEGDTLAVMDTPAPLRHPTTGTIYDNPKATWR